MIQEFKKVLVADEKLNNVIKEKIKTLDDQNYVTLKNVAMNKIFESEMAGKLVVAMEEVIENQVEENEKLEILVQDQTKHIDKLSKDLSKYSGECNTELCQFLKTEYRPKTKSQRVSKSRALILEQLNKNKEITY